jgi:hypothetical protein
LWCLADGQGRLEERIRRIKAEVLPYDDYDIETALAALARAGFINRYNAGGINIIQVSNFGKHQRITGKEFAEESAFPAPAPPPGSTGEPLEKLRESTGETSVTTERKEKKGKGQEGKGRKKKGTRTPPSADTPQGHLDLPTTPPEPQPDVPPAPPALPEPPEPKTRKRNPLFDALAACDGSDPLQLTQQALRAVGVALADIIKVCPDLTPEEIARRAENYCLHMDDVMLTPSALARWWAKCDAPPARQEKTAGKRASFA